MTSKLIITAMMLALTSIATADFEVVEEAHEIMLSDLQLPIEETGMIAFKECAECTYQRVDVSKGTEYRINGKAVPLKDFREAMAMVAEPDNKFVGVLRHVRRNQVTVVWVNL